MEGLDAASKHGPRVSLSADRARGDIRSCRRWCRWSAGRTLAGLERVPGYQRPMPMRLMLPCAVLIALSVVGCSEDKGPSSPHSASALELGGLLSGEPLVQSESNASGADQVTRCSQVRLPNLHFYESYFHADASSGLLDMRFHRTGSGLTRNVAYTVNYQTDRSCRDRSKLAAIISRVTLEGVRSAANR